MGITVREMVEREIETQVRRLDGTRKQFVERLQAGHTAEYAGVERLVRQEKLTNLWTNVRLVFAKADKADAAPTTRQLLEGIRDRVADELITYTVRQSTSLYAVWQDTQHQSARVEFHQSMVDLIRWAEDI